MRDFYDYRPFGESTSPSSPAPNHYLFTGFERDAESALDHTWFRQYSSAQARWLSPDPILGFVDDPQSLNRYVYVRNDPINLVDPYGLFFVVCQKASGQHTNCVWMSDEVFFGFVGNSSSLSFSDNAITSPGGAITGTYMYVPSFGNLTPSNPTIPRPEQVLIRFAEGDGPTIEATRPRQPFNSVLLPDPKLSTLDKLLATPGCFAGLNAASTQGPGRSLPTDAPGTTQTNIQFMQQQRNINQQNPFQSTDNRIIDLDPRMAQRAQGQANSAIPYLSNTGRCMANVWR